MGTPEPLTGSAMAEELEGVLAELGRNRAQQDDLLAQLKQLRESAQALRERRYEVERSIRSNAATFEENKISAVTHISSSTGGDPIVDSHTQDRNNASVGGTLLAGQTLLDRREKDPAQSRSGEQNGGNINKGKNNKSAPPEKMGILRPKLQPQEYMEAKPAGVSVR